MLNPSSADEKDDDPTIKKCIGFAERLGFGSFEVVNLYSLISTDPGNLRTSPDPIGKETDRYILDAAKRANAIILAWGCNHFSEKRDDYIVSMLRNAGYQLSCLKKNEDGCPSHPLFLGFKLVDGKDFKTMNPF
jgi:hypothetical protein